MHTLYRRLSLTMASVASIALAGPSAAHADIIDALKADLPMPPGEAPSAATRWRIRAGSTLRQAIEAWANAASYQVVWHARHGFNIEADATFQGDFLTAVKSLFEGYGAADSPLSVDVYPDQRLLVITSAANAVTP